MLARSIGVNIKRHRGIPPTTHMNNYATSLRLAVKFNESDKVGFYSSSRQGCVVATPASGRVDRYASRTEDNSIPEEFTVEGVPFDANNGVMIGKNRYAFKQKDGGLLILQMPEGLPERKHVDLVSLENGEIITAFLWWGTCSLGVKSSHVSLYGVE